MLRRHHAPQSLQLLVGRRSGQLFLGLWLALAGLASAESANAHDQRFPVEADRIVVNTSQDPSLNAFSIEITDQDPILLTGDFDPTANDSAILVYGTGASAGSTGLLELTGL